MGRYSDNSGVKQTCPFIDEARDFIECIEWDENEQELRSNSIKAVDALETVRSMNAELRKWGNKQYDRVCELEEEIERMQREIDYLERSNKEKDRELSELEKQLSEIEVN